MGVTHSFHSDSSLAKRYAGDFYESIKLLIDNLPLLRELDEGFLSFIASFLGNHEVEPEVRGNGDPLTYGDIYVNTTDGEVYFYTGSEWTQMERMALTQQVYDEILSKAQEVDTLHGLISGLVDDATQINQAVTQLGIEVTQAHTSVTEAAGEVSTQAATVATQYAAVNLAAGIVESLAQTVTTTAAEVATNAGIVTAAQTAIELLAAQVSQHADEVAQAVTQATDQAAIATAAATSSQSSLDQVTSLAQTVDTQTATVTDIQVALTSLAQVVADQASTVNTQAGEVDTALGEVTNLTASAEAAETAAKAARDSASGHRLNAQNAQNAAEAAASQVETLATQVTDDRTVVETALTTISGVVNTVETARDATLAAADSVADAVVTVNTATQTAVDAATAAEYWAGEAATLVTQGVIDDETVSTLKGWSSEKIAQAIAAAAYDDTLIVQTLDTKLSPAPADGKQYVQKDGAWEEVQVEAVAWGNLSGNLSDQTDLVQALGAKANASDLLTPVPVNAVFTDTVFDDSSIQSALSSLDQNKADKSELFSGAFGDLSGIPAEFTPESHTHAVSDIPGLQAAIDAKVDNSRVLTDVPSGAVFTDTVYDDASLQQAVSNLDQNKADKAELFSRSFNDLEDVPPLAPENHTHDDVYYTKAEVDGLTSSVDEDSLKSHAVAMAIVFGG